MCKDALKIIEILQRQAVRSIAGIKPGEGSELWFKKFSVLNFSQLYVLERVVYAHRNLSRFLQPDRHLRNEVYSVGELRRGVLLARPRWFKHRSQTQSPFTIPSIYNGVQVRFKQIMNFKAFRKKYKLFLINKQ